MRSFLTASYLFIFL